MKLNLFRASILIFATLALAGCWEIPDCPKGFHPGGGGLCLSDTDCPAEQMKDGLCCSVGYHNDGFGKCVADGTCREGYRLEANGSCAKESASSCGDGVIGDREVCDQGSRNGATTCLYGEKTCTLCRNDCSGTISAAGPYCGDGMVSDEEICDQGSRNGATTCLYGEKTCTLCENDCSGTISAAGPYCGDGVVSDGEVCDQGSRNGATTCLYGEKTCTLCKNDCSETVPAGSRCGDGIVNKFAGEECDDGSLGSAICNPPGARNGLGQEIECTISRCGDGYWNELDPREQCDNGDLGSSTCNGSIVTGVSMGVQCKLSRCGDGWWNPLDPREECDDGPYGSPLCNSPGATNDGGAAPGCMLSRCSDGWWNPLDQKEECDDGNMDNGDACLNTCKKNLCGDGIVNRLPGGEACDDGVDNGRTSCGYGTPTCAYCNSKCSGKNSGVGPYCGDGTVNASDGEVCDQGSRNGATSCSYGAGVCFICNSTCSAVVSATGPYCGDGEINVSEVCDNGNVLACGTCNDDCTASGTAAAATGTITPVGRKDIQRSEGFTLGDGMNSVTFTFKVDAKSVTPPAIDLTAAGIENNNPEQVAAAIKAAIEATYPTLRLGVAVDPSSPYTIRLTNQRPSGSGNVAIRTSVKYSGFKVTGMSGGAANDCPADARCVDDMDCGISLGCDGSPSTCRPRSYTLEVVRSGTGTGVVSADVGEIDCGDTCIDEGRPAKDLVVLTATADSGSTFTGWAGDCLPAGGNTACILTMDSHKDVTATFQTSP